MPLLQGLTRS